MGPWMCSEQKLELRKIFQSSEASIRIFKILKFFFFQSVRFFFGLELDEQFEENNERNIKRSIMFADRSLDRSERSRTRSFDHVVIVWSAGVGGYPRVKSWKISIFEDPQNSENIKKLTENSLSGKKKLQNFAIPEIWEFRKVEIGSRSNRKVVSQVFVFFFCYGSCERWHSEN